MKKYTVLVIQEAFIHPLTHETIRRKEQNLQLFAVNRKGAFDEANRLCTIPGNGSNNRVIIDGEEFVNV